MITVNRLDCRSLLIKKGIVFFILFVSMVFFMGYKYPLSVMAASEGDDPYCVLVGASCPAGQRCERYDCQGGMGDCVRCVSSCFLPGTKIGGVYGAKNIEDVKKGDVVISFEGDKVSYSKVSSIYQFERTFYYSLVAEDYSVKASAEHPFYVGNGQYQEISKLKPGDTVYVLKGDKLQPKKVISNTRVEKSTPVYNLAVDNTHTFFANGFAVHNKGGGNHIGFWCVSVASTGPNPNPVSNNGSVTVACGVGTNNDPIIPYGCMGASFGPNTCTYVGTVPIEGGYASSFSCPTNGLAPGSYDFSCLVNIDGTCTTSQSPMTCVQRQGTVTQACANMTPPTGAISYGITGTSASFGWAVGTGGTNQLLRVDSNVNKVKTGDPTSLVYQTLPTWQTSYATGTILSPGTTYYWRIVNLKDTYNWLDTGNQCLTSTAMSFSTPLAAPTGLTVTCGSPTLLKWNAVTGATKYAIRINDLTNGWVGDCSLAQNTGDVCNDNISGTTYSFTTTPGHTYSWWVHAVKDVFSAGTAGPTIDCCTSAAPTEKPVVTAPATSTCFGSTTVPISWTFGSGWGEDCGSGTDTFSIKDGATTILNNISSTTRSVNLTLAAGSHTLSVCANNGVGTNCSLSVQSPVIGVDITPPPVPIPTYTLTSDPACRGKYYLNMGWNGVADSGCGGLSSTPYWAQVSNASTVDASGGFSTINSAWSANNTWLNVLAETSSASYTPGTTLYGHVRSRDAFDNQSAWSTTDTVVIPTPSPYPTIHIAGSYSEDVGTTVGTTCVDGISINPALLTIRPTIIPNVGVTPVCSVSANSYACDITVDNQHGACVDPNLSINVVATYTGYETVTLRTGNVCTGGGGETSITAVPGDVEVGNSLFFRTASGITNWFKLKDASFMNRLDGRQNIIPNAISAFDATDNSSTHHMLIGTAGVFTKSNAIDVGPNAADGDGNPVYSSTNWYNTHALQDDIDVARYREYIAARKTSTTITTLDEITGDGIYILQNSVVITDDSIFDGKKVVLVGQSGTTITIGTQINPANGSLALVADTIAIDSTVPYIKGILVANTIQTGTSSTGLKVEGNVIAKNPMTLDRTQSNQALPSLYVVVDPVQYINLLPYFSINLYDWKES